MFCQVFWLGGGAFAVEEVVISEEKLLAVQENCEVIRGNLKSVQLRDAKVRVDIGRYYNAVLEKFMKPLNLRLVENSLPAFESQSAFAVAKGDFQDDYVEYQKGLDDLMVMDCAAEPEVFYQKLEEVREKRAMVNGDTVKIRKLIGEQVADVLELETRL